MFKTFVVLMFAALLTAQTLTTPGGQMWLSPDGSGSNGVAVNTPNSPSGPYVIAFQASRPNQVTGFDGVKFTANGKAGVTVDLQCTRTDGSAAVCHYEGGILTGVK